MALLVDIFSQAFWFMKETAPYMLMGIVIAGMLRHVISADRFSRTFGGNNFKSVGLAAIFGIPLPLCSCSVLPMMVSLRERGASKGAATSFLISTPETGVDSISITYALLDPIFTVARPVAALVTALFTGSVVNFFERRHPEKPMPAVEEKNVGCDAAASAVQPECHSPDVSNAAESPRARSFFDRSLRYGFGRLMDDLTPLLILAFIGSGLIAVIVPDDFFENSVIQGWPGMFLMLIVGVPLYVCASSTTPLVAALLLKGLSPGAALVFLLAGPVTNLGTILAVLRYMGKRVMLIYVICTAGMTLLMGGMIESIYRDLGVPVRAIVGKTTGMLPESVKITGFIVLLVVMAVSIRRTNMIRRWIDKLRSLCAPLGFDPTGRRPLLVATTLLVVLYGMTCFTAVDVGEIGWLFTFGEVERDPSGEARIYEPGLVVHMPFPFQKLRLARPGKIRSLAFGFRSVDGDAPASETIPVDNEDSLELALESQVMNGQESLVSVRFSLQYRLADPYAYTLGFDDPERLIEGYASAAVRTVCARHSTQDILVGHRRELEMAAAESLQNDLDRLALGVRIVKVLFVDVHAPPEVHFAFRDVASASEEKHEQELDGESAYLETLAGARAEAYRIEQEAGSYGDHVLCEAQGKSIAFTRRSDAYRETRELTRLRLFLTAMGRVLSATPIVMPLADGIEIELWLRESGKKEPPFLDDVDAPAGDGENEKQVKAGTEPKEKAPAWFEALRR